MCRRREGTPGLRFRNHIITTRRPHTLWEAPCANSLLWVSFGVCTVYSGGGGGGGGYTSSSGDILVGRLSWEVTYKNSYSCTGTAGPRSSQGIPIRQIDCFLSSPPLIHVFHLSSNEPSAVWHHSGHLCIGPVLYTANGKHILHTVNAQNRHTWDVHCLSVLLSGSYLKKKKFTQLTEL